MTRVEQPFTPNHSQVALIRKMSDRELYPEAKKFAAEHCSDRIPKRSQLQGCLQFSQELRDWTDFVNHQATRSVHADIDFYKALQKWNQALNKRVQALRLTDGVSGAQAKKAADFFGGQV